MMKENACRRFPLLAMIICSVTAEQLHQCSANKLCLQRAVIRLPNRKQSVTKTHALASLGISSSERPSCHHVLYLNSFSTVAPCRFADLTQGAYPFNATVPLALHAEQEPMLTQWVVVDRFSCTPVLHILTPMQLYFKVDVGTGGSRQKLTTPRQNLFPTFLAGLCWIFISRIAIFE